MSHHTCMSSPSRTKSHTKPTYVVVMWRAETGIWQGRVKALPDGREQLVTDMRELVAVVENLQEVQHAKPQPE
ncbi:hypothetical protein DC3_52030 [Deinococcus cellulosilyticus NBRC 106333 = KACC 11606]|uniref:Uncharacterized protein n=2 Tax=Deinococcus cellulosilyticus TaxID=401558 RepID=A0A511NAP7_DEIC1|nr:hypothetical protein DC3_52030 [Deinococcus cellulosilyticus NBRC 106333 = KACC 11606]